MTNIQKVIVLVARYAKLTRFFRVEYADVKELNGFSGGSLVAINRYHKSNTIALYRFPSEKLKSDETLRALLFGRENAKGHFIGSEAVANELYIRYSSYIIDTVDLEILQEYNTSNNLGYAFENYLVNNGYKHGTIKQDKNQKIDVIGDDGKRWQCKASIASDGTKWSYATTNGCVEL